MNFSGSLLVPVLAAFALASAPTSARADEVVRTDHASGTTERNSVPMMITGISLASLGFISSGVGTGLLIDSRLNCRANDAPCKDQHYAGGLAGIVAGSTFAVVGTLLIVGGAWKVPLPATRTASVGVGPGSVGLSGSF